MKKLLSCASIFIILGIFSVGCDNIDIPDFMKDDMGLDLDGDIDDLDLLDEDGVL